MKGLHKSDHKEERAAYQGIFFFHFLFSNLKDENNLFYLLILSYDRITNNRQTQNENFDNFETGFHFISVVRIVPDPIENVNKFMYTYMFSQPFPCSCFDMRFRVNSRNKKIPSNEMKKTKYSCFLR